MILLVGLDLNFNCTIYHTVQIVVIMIYTKIACIENKAVSGPCKTYRHKMVTVRSFYNQSEKNKMASTSIHNQDKDISWSCDLEIKLSCCLNHISDSLSFSNLNTMQGYVGFCCGMQGKFVKRENFYKNDCKI